jgi:hypothetical protein
MITTQLLSIASSTNISALLDDLRQTFLAYLRTVIACPPSSTKYSCPLQCPSKGISSLARMNEHFKSGCPHTRCSRQTKTFICSIWKESRQLLTQSSSYVRPIDFPIQRITAISIEKPVQMLVELLDLTAPSGLTQQWIRRTELEMINGGKFVRQAYRNLKKNKICRVSIHQTQIPHYTPPAEQSIFLQSLSTRCELIDSDSTPVELTVSFTQIQHTPTMQIISTIINSMSLSDSRLTRIKSLISTFLKWIHKTLGIRYDQITRMDLFLVEHGQRFLQNLLDSEKYSVFTKRNFCEDTAYFLKELKLKYTLSSEIYWAHALHRILENITRLNQIWNRKKSLMSAECNSIQGMMERNQYLTSDDLISIKEFVESRVENYSQMGNAEINQLSWKELDLIQSCFLWTLIFRLCPQRTNFFSNIVIGKEFNFSEEHSKFYFQPTAANTKMYFHRRQIRKERIGIQIDLPLQKFLWGCRGNLVGKKSRVGNLDVKQKIPPYLIDKPLFVNRRGSPLIEEALLGRIRMVAVKTLGQRVKSITLRSLRQNFQYLFYISSPSFAELREFNRSMDHTDSTGLIFYNRSGISSEIFTPRSLRLIPSQESSVSQSRFCSVTPSPIVDSSSIRSVIPVIRPVSTQSRFPSTGSLVSSVRFDVMQSSSIVRSSVLSTPSPPVNRIALNSTLPVSSSSSSVLSSRRSVLL